MSVENLVISEQLLKHIIDTYSSNPKDICDGIECYKKINQKITQDKATLEKLRQDYEFNCKVVSDNINRVRKECDHPLFSVTCKYEDSFRTCEICGKDF